MRLAERSVTHYFTPGKTSPRLLRDLYSYDPRRLPSSGYNCLGELPWQYEDGKLPSWPKLKNSCRHRWALKSDQCEIFPELHRLSADAPSVIAAFCEECRCHLRLSIEFQRQEVGLDPCPNQTWPLHHFVYEPSLSQPRQTAWSNSRPTLAGSWDDVQTFRCSSPKCSAQLTVHIQSPRLKPEWVDLLTDRRLIEARADREIAANPERFEGHAVPLTSEVLLNLRKYITNALKGEKRKILGNNKKWLLCLGETCSELLEFLGFTREVPRVNSAASIG